MLFCVSVCDYSQVFAVNVGVKTVQFIPFLGCNHEGLYFVSQQIKLVFVKAVELASRKLICSLSEI